MMIIFLLYSQRHLLLVECNLNILAITRGTPTENYNTNMLVSVSWLREKLKTIRAHVVIIIIIQLLVKPCAKRYVKTFR